MKTVLLLLIFGASHVSVYGGHIEKVVGVRDANGQCICSIELAHLVFPADKVENLESDFFNLTDYLQNQLNSIYNSQVLISTTQGNLTDLESRLKYAKTFGTHVDLDFKKLINDIHGVVSMAHNISKDATTEGTKEMIDKLIKEINVINTVVTKMERYDKSNIMSAQREVILLRKKLEECEEAIVAATGVGPEPVTPSIGDCKHDGILRISEPVLVKLNWKGPDFKSGSWGKDFSLGSQLRDHYWVFPTNKDGRMLETFRLYSTYKKLLLYTPLRDQSLNIGGTIKCETCGQGGGVVLYNGSFIYNCFDSRAICKTNPFTMKISRQNLDDPDPVSFNNLFSYKGVNYQDMDFAGDEKGLWLIHASTGSNGNIVIRNVNPDTLKAGPPKITSREKAQVTNTFMICGVLYATRRKNSTHEEIYYRYDTETSRERNMRIIMEKPRPTIQSLNYNPNDQKLYMYNDGYLVYYNMTFKRPLASRIGQVAGDKGQDFKGEGKHLAGRTEESNPISHEQQDLAKQGESLAS